MDRSAFTYILVRRIALGFALLLLVGCATLSPTSDPAASAGEAAPLFAEGVKAFNRNDMTKSRDLLGRYLELAPKGDYAPDAMLTLGKIDLYQRRYDDAEGRFTAVARTFPDTRHENEARHLLQVTAAERRRRAEDLPATLVSPPSQTGETNPVSPPPAYDSGSFRYEEYQQALSVLQGADAGQRFDAAGRFVLVVDRMGFSDLDRALRESPTGSHERGVLLYRLGAYHMHLRNWEAARTHFDRLLQEDPTHALAPRATVALERLRQRQHVAVTRIGVLLPPGKGRLDLVRGALRMAADEAREDSGGVLEFVFVETRGEAVATSAAVDDLVTNHHVMAIVGGLIGDEAEAAAYRAEQFDVPLVTLSPRAGLTEIGPNVFRVALTPHMQAKAIVDYSWDIKGFRTFAILYPMHPYGQTLAMAFWDEVAKRGGRIAGVERYRHDETTFRTHIRNLVGRYGLSYSSQNWQACRSGESMDCGRVSPVHKDEILPQVDFDALFIPDYAKQVSFIAPAILAEEVEIDNGLASTYGRITRTEHRFGTKIPMIHLLGGNGWNSPRLHEFGGKYVAGALFVDGFFVDETAEFAVTRFISRFTEAHGEAPAAQEAYAYDAVRLVAHVLLESSPQDRDALRMKLGDLAQNPYTGITGRMSFDASGDLVSDLTVLTLQEGRVVPATQQADVILDTPTPSTE